MRKRSSSSSSTASGSNGAREARALAESEPSASPPTSLTDVGSVISIQESKTVETETKSSSKRVRRSRSEVFTYNENTLSKNTRFQTPTKTRVVTTEYAIEKDGEQNTETTVKSTKAKARRVHVVHKVGKRRVGKRRLRPRGAALTAKEERALRSKDAQADEGQADAKPVKTTKRRKRILSQGLYVGQDPAFDPRFNGAKNNKKSKDAPKPNKVLPLPMFGGKRLLDTGRKFKLPFNVFSPLPPGQPKPEEWLKTRKNVFVGDAGDIWKHSKKMEYSTCICDRQSGCDENCFNRFMFYECDENNCNVGPEHCSNRSFEDLKARCKINKMIKKMASKYSIGVEVIKTVDKGYGVRSNRTFEPNQIIVEYTGEIITQDECDRRMRELYKDNECFYLMVFDQNMIIDATRGSIARFVNHSCEPNCKMVKWTVDGKPRMALFAGDKGVMTGEELTYDYNFDPFSSKNIQECKCGSASCRGVLGPRPKERESKEAAKALPQAKTKRKLQDGPAEKAQSANKKRKVASAPPVKNALNKRARPPVAAAKRAFKVVKVVKGKPARAKGATARRALRTLA